MGSGGGVNSPSSNILLASLVGCAKDMRAICIVIVNVRQSTHIGDSENR